MNGNTYGSLVGNNGTTYTPIDTTGRFAENDDDDDNNLTSSDSIKSVIFGGIDGIVTSFSIICGAAGGKLPWNSTLLLGLAAIFANGFNVGCGEFLSSKAHRDFVDSRIRQQFWEFKNTKETEMRKMMDTFISRGMTAADAEAVTTRMAKYEKFFVNMMVTEQMGLQLPSEDDATLLQDAFIMFTSYTGIGVIPLLLYFLGPMKLFTEHELFFYSTLLTSIVLFILGVCKSNFSSISWFVSGFETLCIGSACAVVAYGVGKFISIFFVTAF